MRRDDEEDGDGRRLIGHDYPLELDGGEYPELPLLSLNGFLHTNPRSWRSVSGVVVE